MRAARLPGVTGTGLAVTTGGAGLLAAGLAVGYPALAGVGLAAQAAVLLAFLLVCVPAKLTASRTLASERVTVNAGASGTLIVRNTGRLPALWIEATDLIDGARTCLTVPALPVGADARHGYELETPHRGLVTVGPLTLRRRDPLGLAQSADWTSPATRVWVHPRVHPLKRLPMGGAIDSGGSPRATPGTTASSSLREYQPGDDPRRIHWRSTARIGTLVVREQADTTVPALTVVLDTRSDVLSAEEFEAAVEVVASLVAAADRTGRNVTLALLGEDVADAARAGARGPMDRLAAVRRSNDQNINALTALIRKAPAHGLLVVVTGQEGAAVLRITATRGLRRVAVVEMAGTDSASSVAERAGNVIIRAASGADAVSALGRLAGAGR
ncbi:DUF58 domain-containing protein [Streptosporangium sp. DT93]|uniref:DUF58 domain-containing protein n=1 Tax=Streptosporangium sp. DT93 TaxID=3393428 RepID=UPI003CEA8573